MNSKEFLIENEYTPEQQIMINYNLSDKLMQFAGDVRRDCQYFLNQVQNPLQHSLYRGVSRADGVSWNDIPKIVDKPIRLDNRTPRDSMQEFHDGLNRFMEKNYGEYFRESLFCTGSRNNTEDYGDTYIIFPKGDFKFLWSKTIKDAWSEYASLFREEYFGWLNELKNDGLAPDVLKAKASSYFFDQHFKKSDYSTTNLKEAINSRHEIMIRGGGYYGILADELSSSDRQGLVELFNL